MKTFAVILISLVVFVVILGGLVFASDLEIVDMKFVELNSVLDCPLNGFAIVYYLEGDGREEIVMQIEASGPKENVAGLTLELRYGEENIHQFDIDEYGRARFNLKTARLEPQDFHVWIIDTPQMFIDFYHDHPNLLVEDGHMLSLETSMVI